MPQSNDLSRSLVPFEQEAALVAVIELSQSSWLIAGTVPGVARQPLKKIAPDEGGLACSCARCACKPGAKAAEVHGGSREHVLQVGFGEAEVAGVG